jgi:methyl coenzyme M reductase subunit C
MEQPDKLSEDLGSLIIPVDNPDFLVPGIKDSRISPLSPLTGSEVQDSLSSIWRGLQAREANISTSEKVLNKFSDTASALFNSSVTRNPLPSFPFQLAL